MLTDFYAAVNLNQFMVKHLLYNVLKRSCLGRKELYCRVWKNRFVDVGGIVQKNLITLVHLDVTLSSC
jgi:hypothetical protein